MSTLKEKSIKGLFWDFSGRIGLQGVGFVVSIVLARLLAPEEFGILAIITVFINLANVFLDFGFGVALIQKQDVREEHFSAVFYLNLVMGLLLSAVVFFLAPVVGRFYDKEILVSVTRLMALGISISSFGQVIRARLQRELNFKPISLATIYAAVISGIIAMAMAWRGFGVWSLAVQSIVLQLLTVVFLFHFCKFKINLRFNRTALAELWPFSSKLFFSGLLDTIFFNLDSLIIGKLISPATLGYYHRAKSLENFGFRYTASTIASVLLPGLSSLQNDPAKFREAVMKVFHLLSFVSFLMCGLFLVGGREIIIILFSAKWEPSVIMFQILIAGAFASQIYTLFYNVLLSSGNSKKYLYLNIIHKTLLFINFYLIVITDDLTIYLFGFTAIRILLYFLGLIVVSKQLNLKNKLLNQTVIYLFIYILSLFIVYKLVDIINIESLYLNLSISCLSFLISFVVIVWLINRENLHFISSEAKKFLIKIDRSLFKS
jgi:O-antigen/teichoic acid export membrane protein